MDDRGWEAATASCKFFFFLVDGKWRGLGDRGGVRQFSDAGIETGNCSGTRLYRLDDLRFL